MQSKAHFILWIVSILLFAFFLLLRFSEKMHTSRLLLLSHGFGQSHPIHKFLENFAQEIELESRNKIRVKIYDSSQLGAEPQFVEQIRLGALDGGIVSNHTLARFSPDFLVLQYPYVFTDEQQTRMFLNTEGENYLRCKLSETKSNLTLCCSLTNGMNGMYFTKNADRFMHLDKSQDFYFASNAHPVYKKFFAQQGLLSIPIAKGEIYSALQMGMLHAGENTLPGLIGSKHNETAKFFVKTNHSSAIFFFVMNSRIMNSFDENEVLIFNQAWKEAKASFEKKKSPDCAVLATKGNVILQIPNADQQIKWRKVADKIQANNSVPWNRKFYKKAKSFGEYEK